MRRRGGQGKGDETVSTGCELHCVLRLGCRGPFVLSRGGGPDILAPGLQFLPLALFGPLTGFPAVSLQSLQGGTLFGG